MGTVSARWSRMWMAFGGLWAVGYFFVPVDFGFSNAYFTSLAVLSAGMIFIGTRLNRPPKAVIWYLFAAAGTMWALGDAIFGFNYFTLHEDAFPSVADGFYLAAYPLHAAALFVLIRGRTPGRDRAGLLDASIIATGLALVTWAFIMRPTADDGSLTTLERLVSLAYPAVDVLLIAMVARLFTTPGARSTSYRLLVAALLLLTGSDIAYAVVNTVDSYQGGLVDLGWMLSYVAWGAAALHPSMRSLSETAPDAAVRVTRRRLAVLTTTSLVAPVILVQQGLSDPTRVDWRAASLGAIVLFLLVLARMSGLVAQVQDQAAQLDALAHNDALTGVPNRRAWDLELARALANGRRSGTPVVVALIDLDHFKRFNDQYGHPAGDRLLKEAAAAWRSQLRDGDLLARYGGEEFGMCFTGVSMTAAVALMARVQAVTPLGQTFSAGLARWSGEEAPERLVSRADEALYQAKDAGRNRVVPADHDAVSTVGAAGAPAR